MFFYSPQQIAELNKASYQSFVNLTGKYMNGLQELAELNVQTIRTIIEESNNFPKDNVTENVGDLPQWQSSMLTQLPGKAASYNRHLHTIIVSTGAEVAREVQRQYESRGGQVNAIFMEAIEKANAASARTAVEDKVRRKPAFYAHRRERHRTGSAISNDEIKSCRRRRADRDSVRG